MKGERRFIRDIRTMDALTEDGARADVDAEMTALTPEDVTGQSLEGGDEVENLRNRYGSVILNIVVWIYCISVV